MEVKKILYNSITVNLPKNIVQLLLGAVLYAAVFGTADIAKLSMAIAGLGLAYSSVYMYNDITDREEDAMDPEKRAWKPIANGSLSVDGAISIYALLLITGVLVSFFVNAVFGAMMVALLFLNFLHSTPYVRLKRNRNSTILNITLIEFIKYSSGWFALSSNISRFPVLLVLMFSVVYSMGYMAYKFKFDGSTIKGNKTMFGIMGTAIFLLFIGSLFSYGFPLGLVLLLALSACVFVVKHIFWRNHKSFNQLLLMEFILLPLIIISFLALNIPSVSMANSALAEFLKAVAGG